MSVIDKFMSLMMEREEDMNSSPIIQHGNTTFIFIKYNSLYLVATSKKNANVTLVFSFLHKLVQVSLMSIIDCFKVYLSKENQSLFDVKHCLPVHSLAE